MKVARGSVLDRPWGITLGSFGLRRVTGQLTLTGDDGKVYAIAFLDGSVAGASSPLASDSAARIALTSHLVTSSQISEITKRLAAEPERDEIETLADAARLGPEHVETLRRRVITQRAARMFSVESGDYVVEDEIALPIEPPCEVDLRAVIYHGIRMNLAEQRLAQDLREIGSSYVLKPGALDMIERFGFSDQERPVLDALRDGTSLAELEATQRETEPRTMQAIVYALVACGVCDATGGKPAEPRAPRAPALPRTATRLGPAVARTATSAAREIVTARIDSSERDTPFHSRTTTSAAREVPYISRTMTAPAVGRTPTPQAPRTAVGSRPGSSARPAGAPVSSRTGTGNPAVPRAGTPQRPLTPRAPTVQGTGPAVPRTLTPSKPRTITARRLAAREVEALIATRTTMLADGADHFAFLGLVFDAPLEAVRAAYFNLARQLHPDKIADLEGELDLAAAARVFAQVSAAFTTLTDPVRRVEYVASVRRGDRTPIAARTRTGDADKPVADKIALASDAFHRGEAALRREDLPDAILSLSRSVELDPSNVDYAVSLAWARFCASSDKPSIAPEIKKALEKGVLRSPRPELARFFLGRVERMLGRDREALRHFQEVIDLTPNNADARAEIRAIEARLASRRR